MGYCFKKPIHRIAMSLNTFMNVYIVQANNIITKREKPNRNLQHLWNLLIIRSYLHNYRLPTEISGSSEEIKKMPQNSANSLFRLQP